MNDTIDTVKHGFELDQEALDAEINTVCAAIRMLLKRGFFDPEEDLIDCFIQEEQNFLKEVAPNKTRYIKAKMLTELEDIYEPTT